MNANVVTVLISSALILTLGLIVGRFRGLRTSYYKGIAVWGRWLPVFACGVFLAVVAANITDGGTIKSKILDLSGHLSSNEMIVLFLIAPFFLSRVGSALAGVALIYIAQNLFFSGNEEPKLSLYLLLAATTVIMILGDKMPWKARIRGAAFSQKLRGALLVILAIGALGVIFAAIIKLHAFTRWLNSGLGLLLPSSIVATMLLAMFFGWLSIVLGFTRHLTLPLLSLPTLFVLAFATSWVPVLLVIPFAACIALSIATVERRHEIRRRATGFSTTYVFTK